MSDLAAGASPPQMDEVGLDPIFFAYVHVFVSDILSLVKPTAPPPAPAPAEGAAATGGGSTDEPFLLASSKRPVKNVEICGVVVNRLIERRRILYAVDDGTGLVQVARLSNGDTHHQAPEFAIGQSVIVRGSLSRYGRSPIEVKVSEMRRSTNPNEEVLHWCTAADRARSTYHQPLVYDDVLRQVVDKWKQGKNRKRGAS